MNTAKSEQTVHSRNWNVPEKVSQSQGSPDGKTLSENRGGVKITCTYDRENRLTIKNDNGTITTMTYNGDGQRITRKTSSKLTTFIWDGSDYIQEKSS